MTVFGLSFTAPWLLLGLAALPILWVILRAVPPAPVIRRFPGIALLFGLKDDETITARTPWWLLLLRMAALAALIIGFAGPVSGPAPEGARKGPLLVLMDASWGSAPNWDARIDAVDAALARAEGQERPVAVVPLTTDLPAPLLFQPAGIARQSLANLTPNAWLPDDRAVQAWLNEIEGGFDTLWFSDGLDRPERIDLARALSTRGALDILQPVASQLALTNTTLEPNGSIVIAAKRSPAGQAQEVQADIMGRDPSGIIRRLASPTLVFSAGERDASVTFRLPPELRNRITQITLPEHRSAAAMRLADDALSRREVALVDGSRGSETSQLLSPLHYLREALAPTTDVIEGPLTQVLPANPDVIILADLPVIPAASEAALSAWIDAGGVLVRFAGPQLALETLQSREEDPFLPVRLRSGGRQLGGAMSWGEPKTLAPFTDSSPFFGLNIPEDVEIRAQVLAQPGPNLADRVIAELADGTPLVTRKAQGNGQVILFHVTANAAWSNLPISGLFVQMLERLAVSAAPQIGAPETLEGTRWQLTTAITAFGDTVQTEDIPAIDGTVLAEARPSAKVPPGLYSGPDWRVALNAVGPETELTMQNWPAEFRVRGFGRAAQVDYTGPLIAAGLLLLIADSLASLWVSGRLFGLRRAGTAGVIAAAIFGAQMSESHAQTLTDDSYAQAALSEVTLGHVLTGDAQLDARAREGLYGLSLVLRRRTSVEPAAPIGVNIEADELAFFPMLYWPISRSQQRPSPEAYAKLNTYLASGGMIVFDTMDAERAGLGADTPNGRALQQISQGLNIPPLEPVPPSHLVTRTFYLLEGLPGRFAGNDVWVERSTGPVSGDLSTLLGQTNDGVSPIIIGGNDWASAWAMNEQGRPIYPVGRGLSGEQQREMAYRFGVNLMMYVLTGNYKGDQVHVPALLERLGE